MTLVRRIREAYGDPRLFQITWLSALALYGALALDLEVRPLQGLVMMITALATQAFCTWWWRLPSFDPRSPITSSLSLTLLLRTPDLWVAAVVAVFTILTKFTIRRDGKHIFNPTNIALVTAMLVTDQVWVSPGQWGSVAVTAFFIAGLGSLVVHRSARSDVTWAFLVCWITIVVGRSMWLGDPLAIPLHRLQSGALLLFAFFMISDPKTNPDSRAGRIVFAGLVAGLAAILQFHFHEPNALLFALPIGSILMPLIDRLLPGERYQWKQGVRHATTDPLGDGAVHAHRSAG